MHTLPCASGGQDGVCLALSQLSKELMEDNTSGMQAGGCDSSDCLFCQYRSNSPFHLQAYAGKLTTLLRKRSVNGMTLASLNSLVDGTTETGAVRLAATVAATCGGSKRHRTTSSHGITAPSGSQRASACPSDASEPAGPHIKPAATTTAAATLRASATATASHPTGVSPRLGVAHDCLTMCGGRNCAGHTHPSGPVETPSGSAAAASELERLACELVGQPSESAPGADTHTRQGTLPTPTATELQAALDAASAGGVGFLAVAGDAAAGVDAASRASASGLVPANLPSDEAALWPDRPRAADGTDAAGLGPSSLRMTQQLRDFQSHYSRHRHRHYHDPHQQQVEVHQYQHHYHQQQQQQHQERLVGGRPLPDGWRFRPEWRDRTDPAPAALQELLRLPDPGSSSAGQRQGSRRCSSSSGTSHHRTRSGTGSRCGSAGIICALEFSPDGRLLAAGGVDKQIRLYNLSSIFGELGEEEDDLDEEDDDDDELMVGLRPRTYAAAGGGDSGHGGAASGTSGGSGRRSLTPPHGNGDSGGEDDDHEPYGSLLTAVQRMPSKISSMAWSPFLDGVLTVGDYDGVLLQLHIASGHQLADVEAHGGRKIWSVAHSTLRPHLAASTADDRCARLWAGRGLSQCVAMLQPNPRASVCSVDFSPTCEHVLALACADRTAYLYDMRCLTRGPLAALRHHSRPASYCRFLGGGSLVTAATDASLALWDISEAAPTLTGVIRPPALATGTHPAGLGVSSSFQVVQEYGEPPTAVSNSAAPDAVAGRSAGGSELHAAAHDLSYPSRVFRGHRNEKNFVGLSVRSADGLLACGSECSRAFAYHTSWSDPLATLDLPWADAVAETAAYDPWVGSPLRGAAAGAGQQRQYRSNGGGGSSGNGGFVSAVCWQPAEAAAVLGLPPLLASATSMGAVSVSVLAARL